VETYKSTAEVYLEHGSTFIYPDISEDGEQHVHHCLLKDLLPKTLPYDLALRINKDGNMPQLRFNEDGEWHDFSPEGGTGLKAGPWFPYLWLWPGAGAAVGEDDESAPPPQKKVRHDEAGGSK
jgi:hypothetical protein